MPFAPGARVHLPGLGTGVVREARGSNRYAVEIKGRLVIAAAGDIEPADTGKERRPGARSHRAQVDSRHLSTEPVRETPANARSSGVSPSLDLHGKTALEAVEALQAFVNDLLLDGHREARVIHGRSGGRVLTAVHQCLRGLPSVAAFDIDPLNAGATIIRFA